MSEQKKPAIIPPGYRLGPYDPEWLKEEDGPPQFGLGTLLLVQVGFAVFLALLMTVGIWAILVAFLLTISIPWSPWRPRNAALRRLVFDLLAGIAMPVLCLWYDPIVFRDVTFGGGQSALYTYRVWIYTAIGLQLFVLPSWLFYNTLTNRANGVFAGILAVGCLGALMIGILMLPMSLIGIIFFGLGLLGLTPFLTAYAFGRNARRALRFSSSESKWIHGALFVLGIVLAVGFPSWLDATFSDTLGRLIDSIPEPKIPF